MIIVICLQSIYKEIQNSEKEKTCTCRKNLCLRKIHAILYADFRDEYWYEKECRKLRKVDFTMINFGITYE